MSASKHPVSQRRKRNPDIGRTAMQSRRGFEPTRRRRGLDPSAAVQQNGPNLHRVLFNGNKGGRMKSVVAFVAAALLGGCTVMKVAEVDPATGYFPATSKATIVTNKSIDLDSRKSLLLVPNGEFVRGQIQNMKYFDEIMNFDDLEKRVIQAGLTDKVPTIRDRIGVNNAAKHYKGFLWFRFETKGEGRIRTGQFILTDPLTLEDYFVAETKLDPIWSGINDQNTWYPLFNAMIDYIKANSKTFRK